MREAEMDQIAGLIHLMLSRFEDQGVRAEVRRRSRELCGRFPLPYRVP
jgi:glycine/serine hydroxymethyltransferase